MSIKMTYEETMDEKHRKMVLLIQDREISCRLIAAWPMVTREGPEEGVEPAWGNVSFSYTEWCDLAGVVEGDCTYKYCKQLIEQNFVLPDGHIHFWAEKFLDGLADGLLPTEGKK